MTKVNTCLLALQEELKDRLGPLGYQVRRRGSSILARKPDTQGRAVTERDVGLSLEGDNLRVVITHWVWLDFEATLASPNYADFHKLLDRLGVEK